MSAIVEELEMPPDVTLIEAAADEIRGEAQDAIYYPITQRDPNDIRTILRLAVAAIAFAMLSLALAGLLTYKLTRSASLIVVERTPEGDRVIGDDQHYTLSGPVQVRTDKPGDGDKKYLAAKWAESFFQIDPQTHRADIVRGLKMMTPDAAVTLVAQVKQSGEWETQQREEWQAVWKPQAVTISRDDPYKVQLIGQQEISKTIGGVAQHTSRQLVFTLALKPDTAKRTDDNQNTGFRIAGIAEMKILADQATAGTEGAGNPPAISVAPPHPAQ
jgi:hypothetical protein